MEAICTLTGSLVDETYTLCVAKGQCLSHAILNLEGYVVNTTATIVEELLYGALGAGGLQELQFHLTDLHEGSLHLLVFYDLSLIDLRAQYVTELGQYGIDALYGNTQMLNL